MSKVGYLAIDKKSKDKEVIGKCGKCDKNTQIMINLRDKKTQNIVAFPLCAEHLKEFYEEGFFNEITDVNHLKMIEGIIKFGSLKKWLKNE